VKVDAETRLRPNGWSSLEIRVLDLSETGFRARCEARMRAGGCVSIDVPGLGAVDAQVEWQKGDEFGARFIAPIQVERCGWSLSGASSPLAHLLVQRAGAKGAGRAAAEVELRRRILSALPIRRGCASV
jgi:hypothetical protein